MGIAHVCPTEGATGGALPVGGAVLWRGVAMVVVVYGGRVGVAGRGADGGGVGCTIGISVGGAMCLGV